MVPGEGAQGSVAASRGAPIRKGESIEELQLVREGVPRGWGHGSVIVGRGEHWQVRGSTSKEKRALAREGKSTREW